MLCVAQRGAAQSSAVAEHSDSARSDEAVAGCAVAGGAEPGRPAASDEERDGRDDVLGPDSSEEEELARVEADMAATRAARKRSLFVKSQDAQPPQPKLSKATRLTPAQMRLGDCTGMQWLKWEGRGWGTARGCSGSNVCHGEGEGGGCGTAPPAPPVETHWVHSDCIVLSIHLFGGSSDRW